MHAHIWQSAKHSSKPHKLQKCPAEAVAEPLACLQLCYCGMQLHHLTTGGGPEKQVCRMTHVSASHPQPQLPQAMPFFLQHEFLPALAQVQSASCYCKNKLMLSLRDSTAKNFWPKPLGSSTVHSTSWFQGYKEKKHCFLEHPFLLGSTNPCPLLFTWISFPSFHVKICHYQQDLHQGNSLRLTPTAASPGA